MEMGGKEGYAVVVSNSCGGDVCCLRVVEGLRGQQGVAESGR